MGRDKFFAGDRIAVRSPQEILATLDSNGTLDGHPFMPEMLAFCGKSFRVHRRVEKTCVDVEPPIDSNRRFAKNDVVTLEGVRCDGSGHDGCMRGCRIYWKEAWLRPADGGKTAVPVDEPAFPELRSRLKVKADEQRYFCQSTELIRATEAFPGRMKPWLVRIALRQIRQRDLSALQVARLFVRWIRLRLHRAVAGDDRIRGPHTKGTPSAVLDLKPGELVRIKTVDEIVATLDRKKKNRGISVCQEMTRCCGKVAEVRYRVTRLIEERSGTMRELNHTVTLQNPRGEPSLCDECLCYGEMGDCPRGELMYWREIWLERVREQRPVGVPN
ncbi:MAG TPA: hypothetical protein VKH81_21620 [Candidatus Angelobacter sp.]|nr:hypothetical protein [Candidatus Angelobacter sp.]